MDLSQARRHYIQKGYSDLNATARVCQDVILSKIAASSMKENVTVKGGVLMCAISDSTRRATSDTDLDFMHYPINNDAIRSFITLLSRVDDGITVKLVGNIEELSQQDYQGKRVYVQISDGKSFYNTKLDLGVNTNLIMEQEEYWFDLARSSETVSLLGNSKEQMFVEKLKSLLRHGMRSTRFRDLYDMYYLGHMDTFNKSKLKSYIEATIINDPDMWDNNIKAMIDRLNKTLTNQQFLKRMKSSHRDWIGKSAEEVAQWLPIFLRNL